MVPCTRGMSGCLPTTPARDWQKSRQADWSHLRPIIFISIIDEGDPTNGSNWIDSHSLCCLASWKKEIALEGKEKIFSL